ncbi:unnamed protein product [Camellia sinensis]
MGAQMSDILIWPDIIYQSWIDGSLGVYISSSSCENSCRAAIPSTCGQAMEVPNMTVKFTLLESSGRALGPKF